MPRSLHANIGQASHSPAEPVNISDYSSPSTSQQTYDDLGRYVGLATQLSTEKKKELLNVKSLDPAQKLRF